MQSKLHLARKSDIKESDKEVVAGQFFLQKDYQNISTTKTFCSVKSVQRELKKSFKKKKKSRM